MFATFLAEKNFYACTFVDAEFQLLGVIPFNANVADEAEQKEIITGVSHCFLPVFDSYERRRVALTLSDSSIRIFDLSSASAFFQSDLSISKERMREKVGVLPAKPVKVALHSRDPGMLVISLATKQVVIAKVAEDNSFTIDARKNYWVEQRKLSMKGKTSTKRAITHLDKTIISVSSNVTGQLFASGGQDGIVAVYNAGSMEPLAYFHTSSDPVTVAFSGKTASVLYVSDSGGNFFVLNLHSQLLLVTAAPLPAPGATPFVTTSQLLSFESLNANNLKVKTQSLIKLQRERERKKVADRDLRARKRASMEKGLKWDAADEEDPDERKLREIMIHFEDFRRRFQVLLKKNEESDPLEQLEMKDFDIDLEVREIMEKNGREQVQNMKDDIVFHFQGKELVRERIKKECWDSMAVKGQKFNPFVSGESIQNFAMRAETKLDKATKRKIFFARRLELMQDDYYEEIRPDDINDPSFLVSGFTSLASYVRYQSQSRGDTKTNEDITAAMIRSKKKKLEGLTGDSSKTDDKKKKDKKGDDDSDNSVDGFEALLYHPLDCYTVCRKRVQAAILGMNLAELKEKFNLKFNQFYLLKQREIEQVLEKSKRIEEIQDELHLQDKVFRPKLSPEEIADSILHVRDEDVKAKKVLSPEEQAEVDRKAEELRLKMQNRDDAPERALKDMMNGTLETKRDLSLLEEELIKEDWMDTTEEADMTEEMLVKLATYQKQVKLIQQEQENRRKLLYTELSKLKSDVNEIFRLFDGKLKTLAHDRIEFVKVMNQIELMQVKLLNDAVKEEEREANEKAKVEELMLLEQMQSSSFLELQEFHQRVDSFSKQVEAKQLAYKQSERSFKKDFVDAGEYVDVLFRMFRSRPQHAPKARPTGPSRGNPGDFDRKDSTTTNRRTTFDPNSPEIHRMTSGSRGSSRLSGSMHGAFSSFNIKEQRKKALNPFEAKDDDKKKKEALHAPLVCPDGLDQDIFVRFMERRMLQLEREKEIKAQEEVLADMNTHLAFLVSVEKTITAKIAQTTQERITLAAQRRGALLNTEVILDVEQGKVEIEESPVVTDMNACEMITRDIVEELSELVCKYGNEKVDVLREIMGCHTAIEIRKWTLERQDIELRDQMDLNTELQLLRVTKNLQSLIKMGGHDSQKAAEVKRLNQKIEFLQQSSIEKMDEKRSKLKKVKTKIRNQNSENNRLLLTVNELEQSVRERLQISQLKRQETQEEKKSGDLRMKAIVTRRKLVDLAKLQSEEVHFLRSQVEGLRKRTFASFALPDDPVNPDEINDLALTYEERSRMSTARSLRAPSRAQSMLMSRQSGSRHDPRSSTAASGGIFGDIPSRPYSRAQSS